MFIPIFNFILSLFCNTENKLIGLISRGSNGCPMTYSSSPSLSWFWSHLFSKTLISFPVYHFGGGRGIDFCCYYLCLHLAPLNWSEMQGNCPNARVPYGDWSVAQAQKIEYKSGHWFPCLVYYLHIWQYREFEGSACGNAKELTLIVLWLNRWYN